MSRCFPFPPPGYTLSSARKEIMIELIKLHKEKQRKKEKRREKKERRRKERKERRKIKKDERSPNSDKSDIAKDHIGQQVCSDESSEKRRESKSVKSELSSLTEEHGRPSILPVPSSSCESTENTSNRNKRASPEDDSHGRLSEASLMVFVIDFHDQLKARERAEICNTEGINLRNNREEICSTSGQIEAIARGKTVRSMPDDDAVNPMQGVELQYKNLLANWLPPQLPDTSLYTVDSDWLFRDSWKNREKQDEKRRRCGSGNISCVWARAEYLPEVGAFALPYVVPY
ncbi:hypothetical protein ACS0TY_036583 [Phlomoides rotata]